MKFKIIIVSFLITLSVLPAFSQTKGFMGKTFLFQADLYMSRNKEYGLNTWNVFIPRTIFSPGMEYVVGHKISVGGCVNFFKYGFNPSSSIEYMYQDSLPTKLFMNGLGASIYFKQYIFRNSHAPYGSFIKIQLDTYGININTKNFGKLSDDIMGLKFEFGYDYMIGNRIRISWGTYLGFTNELFRIFNTQRTNILLTSERKFYKDFLIGTKISFGFLTS